MMVTWIRSFNFIMLLVFSLCYCYQLGYVLVRFFKKDKTFTAKKLHRYAVLISARNEGAVIGELLESIHRQNYPKELLDVYVVADNCTDNTAQIAEDHGAIVYERFDRKLVGKGYALNYLFGKIYSRSGLEAYDGYFVFDADNVLDENYIREMNKVFDNGYEIVTSYRNSKNYGSNWISAGYALWFLRESKYLNGARMQCGTSCAISGTGFLVSNRIIRENNGWKHHLLTEDIEFSTDNIIQGRVIGYSEQAVLYDEQPTDFHESWNQRLRWTKGFYQVFANYGGQLLNGVLEQHRFQCYDMLMTLAPATLLTLLTILLNSVFGFAGMMLGHPMWTEVTMEAVLGNIVSVYSSLFFFGVVTTITEWKHIHCSWQKKIRYLFTFPIFIFTYVPIAIVALFKKVTWVPIRHTVVKSVQQIRE